MSSPEEEIARCYGHIVRRGLVERLNKASAGRQIRSAAAAFFQAGVLRHKLLFLSDMMHRFERDRTAADPNSAFFEHFVPSAGAHEEGIEAERRYRLALALAPDFAEAKYNLGLLRRRSRDFTEALRLFEDATTVKPHVRGMPHAHLAANALWQTATIHHMLGDNDAASHAYGRALSLLDNFGVDHLDVALFFRRQGHLAEAVEQFERIMSYSHLYAAEFVEPNYTEQEQLPLGPDRRPCDPLLATPIDDIQGVGTVYYWWHLYILVPEGGPTPDMSSAVLRWVGGLGRIGFARLWGRQARRRISLDVATSIEHLCRQHV